jgi:hypothetical protein
MKNSVSQHRLCNFCKKQEATTKYKIYQGSEITNYIVIAATITENYLLVPACETCFDELDQTKNYRTISGVVALVCIVVIIFAFSSIQTELERNQSIFYDLIIIGLTAIPFIFSSYYFLKSYTKFSFLVSKIKTPDS